MKKILSLVLILAVFSACGIIQIRQPTEELFAKIAGRRAGYWLALNHSDVACRSMSMEKLIDQLNPIDAADVRDFLDLIKVQGLDSPATKAAMEGFSDGLKLGGCDNE